MTGILKPLVRREFLDCNKGLLSIGALGDLRYTEEGRSVYGSLFRRYGYSIWEVTSLSTLRRTMRGIAAQQARESCADLIRRLYDPRTSKVERALLADVLDARPARAAPELVPVVNLAAWRGRRRDL